MKVSRVAVLLFAVAVVASHADETNLTLTVDGVTYSNVTFRTVTPSTVTVFHKTGIATVPLAKLPPDLQQRFGYDPVKERQRLEKLEADRQALAERKRQEDAEVNQPLTGNDLVATTARAETRDDINLSFVNDPQVIGTWESVDFVRNISDFVPDKEQWTGKRKLKSLTFLEGGKNPEDFRRWTKGVLIHKGDRTASHYEIKQISGSTYMFLEWKSGDYIFRGMKPQYYVLKKKK